jgi:hypothetical protein
MFCTSIPRSVDRFGRGNLIQTPKPFQASVAHLPSPSASLNFGLVVF